MITYNTVSGLKRHLDRVNREIEDPSNIQKFEKELDSLKEMENEIYKIIKNKLEDVTPYEEDEKVYDKYIESEKYRSIIKLIGKDEEFEERFGFNRTMFEISNSNNIDTINDSLRIFISDMKRLGIILEYSNFNYSTYTEKYMELFYENINNNSFYQVMKNVYNSICFECPLFLVHLELCIKNIIINNKNIIVKHLDSIIDTSLNKIKSNRNEIYDLYTKTRIQFEDLKLNDKYNLLLYLDANRNSLKKYHVESKDFKQLLGSLTNVDLYNSSSRDDKKFILRTIKELYYDLIEYKTVFKFKNIYDYLSKLLEEKDNINISSNSKEIKKLEKEKAKLDKKRSRLIKRRNSSSFDIDRDIIVEINDEIKTVDIELEKIVKEIKRINKEYNYNYFRKELYKNYDNNSSIFDISIFFSKYYEIIYDFIKNNSKLNDDEIREIVDEFRHIQYMARSTIMKSIPFTNIKSIKKLIEKKYSLYNINVELDSIDSKEFNKLFSNVEELLMFGVLDESSLDIKTCEMILKFKDCEEEKVKHVREILVTKEII